MVKNLQDTNKIMEKRKDMFGVTPEIGDTVVWNPARYKGLVFGKVIDYRKNNGLPIIEADARYTNTCIGQNTGTGHNHYVPKTEFVVKK